jgi:hypothetical protein
VAAGGLSVAPMRKGRGNIPRSFLKLYIYHFNSDPRHRQVLLLYFPRQFIDLRGNSRKWGPDKISVGGRGLFLFISASAFAKPMNAASVNANYGDWLPNIVRERLDFSSNQIFDNVLRVLVPHCGVVFKNPVCFIV